MKQPKFPKGWSEVRVRKVIAHYETQSEHEAVAEDEAGVDPARDTVMKVPRDLVPKVRQLIAKRKVIHGGT